MAVLLKCQRCSFFNQERRDRRWFRDSICNICRNELLNGPVQQDKTLSEKLEPCALHSDLLSLDRPDIPSDMKQLMIVDGNKAMLQGQWFTGELCVNTVALRRDGSVVFMLKLQDPKSLPRSAADTLVQQIGEVAPHCPAVPRGKNKTAPQGWMKCMLDRFSRSAGEFGRTRAEQQNSFVADLADRILQGETDAVCLAFPRLMNEAFRRMPPSDGLGQFYNGKWSPFSHVSITGGNYASPPHKDKKDVGMNFIIWYLLGDGTPPLGDVFQFNELGLSFTPGHGTMLAFEPARTTHSTAVPHAVDPKCQRIGSAISLQSYALKKAVNAHADIIKQQALVQSLQLELVQARTQLGKRKNGEPKHAAPTQQSKLPSAKQHKAQCTAM